MLGLVLLVVLAGALAVGTRHIPDDPGGLGVYLFGDGREGAEKLAGDVSEDGGAAGTDFVLGEEEEQAGEEVIDLSGGGEVVQVDGESGSDFDGVLRWRRGRVRVLGAKRLGGEADQAATHAVRKSEVAAIGRMDGAGFNEWLGHRCFLFSEMG